MGNPLLSSPAGPTRALPERAELLSLPHAWPQSSALGMRIAVRKLWPRPEPATRTRQVRKTGRVTASRS